MILRAIGVMFLALFFFVPKRMEALQVRYEKPEVGKSVPDFELNYISHYRTKSASNDDFKGKWLFMDFWFTGCATCIYSFPKVNELQKEFRDEAVFLMVGVNDNKYNRGIERLYEKLREKKGLMMPSAYDSVLVERWGINAMPYIIIIDPNGIVRHITGGRDMTEEKVRDMLNGKQVTFYPHSSVAVNRPDFDFHNSNGTKDKLLYQSTLTQWNGERQYTPDKIFLWMKFIKKDGLKMAMVPLSWLYNYAYVGAMMWDLPTDSLYGKVYPFPIIETKDSVLFQFDYNTDVGKGTYNYSLVVPHSMRTVRVIMSKMQDDLKFAFGHDASLEIRDVPVWNLIVTKEDEAKLRSKHKVQYFNSMDSSSGAGGFTMENYSIDQFLDMTMTYIGLGQPPYFNETGIEYNIDITIDADMTRMDSVKKELRKNGLDLVKGTRKMLVLVVKDPTM